MSFEAAVFWNCVEATARWRAEQKEFRPAFRDADLGVLSAVEATVGIGFGGDRPLAEIKASRRIARDPKRVREAAHA